MSKMSQRSLLKRSVSLPQMGHLTPDARIYSVVAASVQTHLGETKEGFAQLTPDSKTVIQPYGRMTAQHGHVVSKMRVKMAMEMIYARNGKRPGITLPDYSVTWEGITTIVKVCRDSLEMAHVKDLLEEADLEVEEFFDTNPEYGPEHSVQVRTAICTWPVYKENVMGILDYLPLLNA